MPTKEKNTDVRPRLDKRGYRQGEYKTHNSDGQVLVHCNYKDDQFHGKFTRWYYSNGVIHECHNFHEGALHGEYKDWWPSGNRWVHAFYNNDERHGEYKAWYDNGILVEHWFYLQGTNITDEVKALVKDINDITDEERMLIKLRWGIECLPK